MEPTFKKIIVIEKNKKKKEEEKGPCGMSMGRTKGARGSVLEQKPAKSRGGGEK